MDTGMNAHKTKLFSFPFFLSTRKQDFIRKETMDAVIA